MKVATWNCNMAFRRKKDELLEHDPDVLVIQECENPEIKGEWSEFSDWHWIGDNEHKGLGVFTRNDLSVEPLEIEVPNGEYALPVKIGDAMTVVGIWAMNDKTNPKRRYIGQVYTALQHLRDVLDSETVVAGDFNWNVIWDDSPSNPLCGNFADTVEILNELGLCSSYHRVTESEFGEESDPTFFMHKKRDREYHTDYLFVPERKVGSVGEFSVGTYQNWIEASDHMPIMIEMME